MTANAERDAKVVGPEEARSTVGRLLGDGLVGSCWRAAEQAETPDVEVRVYVRSFAEASIALELLVTILTNKRLLRTDVRKDAALALADGLGAVVALELTNGSVVALKKASEE